MKVKRTLLITLALLLAVALSACTSATMRGSSWPGLAADEKSIKSWDISIHVEFDTLADVEAYLPHPDHRDYVDNFLKPKLAVSLVSPRDEVRNRLVPVNKRYPLETVFDALGHYAKATRHRITFEYVLLEGVNDSPEDARLVWKWLRPLPAKLNLIVYNPTGDRFRPSEKITFQRFYQFFLKAPFPVTFRENMGADIDAACGQLWTRTAS
jgi:adenine C2-methylase RlmN of 23S rRNA A2503 and tRNA A37